MGKFWHHSWHHCFAYCFEIWHFFTPRPPSFLPFPLPPIHPSFPFLPTLPSRPLHPSYVFYEKYFSLLKNTDILTILFANFQQCPSWAVNCQQAVCFACQLPCMTMTGDWQTACHALSYCRWRLLLKIAIDLVNLNNLQAWCQLICLYSNVTISKFIFVHFSRKWHEWAISEERIFCVEIAWATFTVPVSKPYDEQSFSAHAQVFAINRK